MTERHITALKFSLDDDGEIVAAGGQINLFAGFSKGLCDKFDMGTTGSFTRCASGMADDVDDSKAFCASLHKYCTGGWPSQKGYAFHEEVHDFIATRADASPKEGESKYGDVKFADEKNKKYPIDTEEHIRAAWNYINKSANASKYGSGDVATIKSKIVAAWKSKIDKDGPPSAVAKHRLAGYSAPSRSELMAKCKKDHPDWTPAQMNTWVDKAMEEDKSDQGDDEDKEMVLAYSNAINGVEIFRTGTHNGDEYTEQDLDDMVEAFGTLDFKPAIKVGHTKDRPGSPAYGWVQNLKRVGSKLVADFTDMHDNVVEAVRKRLYDRVSSEIYFNLKRGDKTFRRALKAVALLGVDVPAVAGLTPLHKVQFAGEDDGVVVHTAEQALEVSAQAMAETLAERVAGLIKVMEAKGSTSEEHDMNIKELQAKVKLLTEQMKKLGEGKTDEERNDIKTMAASIAALTDEIDKIEKADNSKALTEANAKIASLEAKDRNREVQAKVAAVKVPAFRPSTQALYAYAMEHTDVKLKVYAKDKDGKDVAAEKSLVEVVDAFVAEINAQGEKWFKSFARTGETRSEDTEEEHAQDEVDKRVKKYLIDHPEVKLYSVAMEKVLASDGELAKRYKDESGQRAAQTH